MPDKKIAKLHKTFFSSNCPLNSALLNEKTAEPTSSDQKTNVRRYQCKITKHQQKKNVELLKKTLEAINIRFNFHRVALSHTNIINSAAHMVVKTVRRIKAKKNL